MVWRYLIKSKLYRVTSLLHRVNWKGVKGENILKTNGVEENDKILWKINEIGMKYHPPPRKKRTQAIKFYLFKNAWHNIWVALPICRIIPVGLL